MYKHKSGLVGVFMSFDSLSSSMMISPTRDRGMHIWPIKKNFQFFAIFHFTTSYFYSIYWMNERANKKKEKKQQKTKKIVQCNKLDTWQLLNWCHWFFLNQKCCMSMINASWKQWDLSAQTHLQAYDKSIELRKLWTIQV